MSRAIALLCILAGAGCFIDFEELRDQSQSDSVGPEPELSGDFGVAVASVPLPPGSNGLRFVVAGTEPFSISTYVYDATGSVTFSGIEPPDLPPTGPVVLRVANPAISLEADGLFAVGFPADQLIAFFEAGRGLEPPRLIQTITPQEACQGNSFPGFGRDFVVANTDVGANNLVVLADQDLVLLNSLELDGTDNCIDSCRLDGQAPSLVAADLDPNSGGRELIVPIRRQTSTTLQLFNGTDIPTAAGRPCTDASDVQIASGLPPGFGALMLSGDIDAMPGADLVVFTPGPDELTVLLNFELGGGSNTPPARFQSPLLRGTTSLAIGDIDPLPGTEILAGVPINGDGDDDGRVHVFAGNPPGTDSPLAAIAELRDSTTEDNQQYGRGVAAGRFRVDQDIVELPVVGANGEVFTVFQPTPASDDPRL